MKSCSGNDAPLLGYGVVISMKLARLLSRPSGPVGSPLQMRVVNPFKLFSTDD